MKRIGGRYFAVLFIFVVMFAMAPGGAFANESTKTDTVTATAEQENSPLISTAEQEEQSVPVPVPSATPELDVPRPYHAPPEVLAEMSSLDALRPTGAIRASAVTTYYRNLAQHSGSLTITGSVSGWHSSNPDIATYEGGKILAHNLGTATLTLRLTSGNTAVYHISSFWSYPQPKKSVVNHDYQLRTWAAPNNHVYTGDSVKPGEVTTVLWSVAERSASGENSWIYQYVRKSNGREGYIPAVYTDFRAMRTYYEEIATEDEGVLYTFYESGDVDRYDTDNTWRSSNENIVEVESGTYGGYARQGILTAGTREGTATVTATAPNPNILASGFVTVFTPMVNVAGYTGGKAAVQAGAGENCRAVDFLNAGVPLDITGSCGNFWRVGVGQYIAKSAVRIPVTKVTLGDVTRRLAPGGDLQATAKVEPEIATDKTLLWKSSAGQIAAVDGNGLVRHLSSGSATITATSRSDAHIGDSFQLNCLATAIPILTAPYRGFGELKLKWTAVTGVQGYSLERERTIAGKKQWEETCKLDAGALSYMDKNLSPGTTYRYRLRGYTLNASGAIDYGEYSDVFSVATQALKAMASDNRIYLNWTAGVSAETHEYKVYQIDGKTKKAKLLKALYSKATSFLISNLKAGTQYTYYVTPSWVEGDNIVDGAKSNTISIRTKNVTDGYFYDQIFLARNWCSVYYTAKRATNAVMNDYTIQGVKAAVKYNYAANTNTLYIHVYYRVTGGGSKSKFEYYKPVLGKDNALAFQKTKTSGSTYLALAKTGMTKHWTKSKVKGNKYDFKPGVAFNTKVILHQKSGKGVKGQRYFNLRIGATGEGVKSGGAYWHYATNLHPLKPPKKTNKGTVYEYEQYDYLSGNFILNLSTQKQTVNNRVETGCKSAESSPAAWSNVAAHELGHVLGMNDAYATINEKGKDVSRSVDRGEVNTSIMHGERTFTVTPNDFEMMLSAQGLATKYLAGSSSQNENALVKTPSWQSYISYDQFSHTEYSRNTKTAYYKRYIISPVIRSGH